MTVSDLSHVIYNFSNIFVTFFSTKMNMSNILILIAEIQFNFPPKCLAFKKFLEPF